MRPGDIRGRSALSGGANSIRGTRYRKATVLHRAADVYGDCVPRLPLRRLVQISHLVGSGLGALRDHASAEPPPAPTRWCKMRRSVIRAPRSSADAVGCTMSRCIEPRRPTSSSSAPARPAAAPPSRPHRRACRCSCSGNAPGWTHTPCSPPAASTRRSGRATRTTPGSSTSPTPCARATSSDILGWSRSWRVSRPGRASRPRRGRSVPRVHVRAGRDAGGGRGRPARGARAAGGRGRVGADGRANHRRPIDMHVVATIPRSCSSSREAHRRKWP